MQEEMGLVGEQREGYSLKRGSIVFYCTLLTCVALGTLLHVCRSRS